METPFYIYGAGGHAREVIEAAILSGLRPAGVLDDHPCAESMFAIPIFNAREFSFPHAFRFVVAIGATEVRREKFLLLKSHGGEPIAIMHPRAYVSPSAIIGDDTFVGMGALISHNIEAHKKAISPNRRECIVVGK